MRIFGTCDTAFIRLVVEDTGVGIEQEQAEQLFSAFTKIMKNRNLNKQGVGLGLTISKNLAVALGGDIVVESILGKGSKFTVTLPIRRKVGVDDVKLEVKELECNGNELLHKEIKCVAELSDDTDSVNNQNVSQIKRLDKYITEPFSQKETMNFRSMLTISRFQEIDNP